MESYVFVHTLPFLQMGMGRAPNFIIFFLFICCSHYCSSIKAKAIFFVVLFFSSLLSYCSIQFGPNGVKEDFSPIVVDRFD